MHTQYLMPEKLAWHRDAAMPFRDSLPAVSSAAISWFVQHEPSGGSPVLWKHFINSFLPVVSESGLCWTQYGANKLLIIVGKSSPQ